MWTTLFLLVNYLSIALFFLLFMKYTVEISLPEGETFESCHSDIKESLKTLTKQKAITLFRQHDVREPLTSGEVNFFIEKVLSNPVELLYSEEVLAIFGTMLNQVLVENAKCSSPFFHGQRNDLLDYLKGDNPNFNQAYQFALAARDSIRTETPLKMKLYDH